MNWKKVVVGEPLGRVEQTIGWIIFAAIVLNSMAGCGSTAGWRFQIGVAPVTAIHDEATLKEQPEK